MSRQCTFINAAENDIDVAFFDFPMEEDWIFMGHIVNLDQGFIIDRTLMYHYFGYQLFRKMGRYCHYSDLKMRIPVSWILPGIFVSLI